MQQSSFFKSFLILFLAAILFVVAKPYLPKKLFPEQQATANQVVDSTVIEAISEAEATDELNYAEADSMGNQPIVYVDESGIQFPSETAQSYTGNQHLISFYEKLRLLESNPSQSVRIAYFGDSMTDGDLIVQDLRSAFQSQFGGTGVGFVPLVSESAGSRSSVKHSFGGSWKDQNFVTSKYSRYAFGINGHVFYPTDSLAWVRYEAGRQANVASLPNPTLFYGSSRKNGRLKVTYGKDSLWYKLDGNLALNTLRIGKSDLKKFRADFIEADSIPIYGFNFDNGKGVHIDNFSQRGNSGMPLSKLNPQLLNQFQKKLGYDLIILHYGTNVLNYGTKNYNWYQRGMQKAIANLRAGFPGVPILLISAADKATKYDMEMRTDSAVVPLTLAQRKLAVETRSGFINLFELMGGNGSMVRWVDEVPALANKDYTHFNFRGAKKVASLFYQKLQSGFITYKRLKSKVATEAVLPENDSIPDEEM